MMRRYAQNTFVPINRSRDEISSMLERHGATGFIFGTTSGQALLAFEMKDRRLRFLVPMPNKTGTNEKVVSAEQRRRYRALLLVLKAKLEAVDSQIVTFDEEFLAHIVIEGNTTVGDRMVPAIPQALKSGGKLPPLLGAGEVEAE